MGAAAIPDDEPARLESLRSRDILDTPPEDDFDDIVRMAAELCDVPIALVSLVDEHRQWFKAKIGLDVDETPRELAYCAHAILGDSLMEVPDASVDPRFADNPLRTGPPFATFYAGVPLRTADGHTLGTLCVIDHEPKRLTDVQRQALEALATQVVRLLEARRARRVTTPKTMTIAPTADEVDPGLRPEFTRGSRLALLIMVLLGVGSIVSSVAVHRVVHGAERVRLGHATLRAARFLEDRANTYEKILRGAAALYGASDTVTGGEFRAYVSALEIDQRGRGILGIGLVARVPRDETRGFVERARTDHPDFELFGEHDGAERAIIRHIEPLATNARALGFDMRSSPERRRALDASMRTGSVAVTEPVVLRQDPNRRKGFIFLLPARDPAGAHIGWVFAVVRADAFVSGLDHASGDSVRVSLQSAQSTASIAGDPTLGSEDAATAPVTVADQTFVLRVAPGPRFVSPSERLGSLVVLALGLCATALAYVLVNTLRRVETRSHLLAAEMTASLRTRTRELDEVVDGTADLILAFDEAGQVTFTNRAFRHVLGYDAAVAERMSILDVIHDSARAGFEDMLAGVGDGERNRTVETTFVSRDGTPIDVEGALSHEVRGEQAVTRAIFRDVSARNLAERALVAANATLEKLASGDALTGVANRRAFDTTLTEEVARARRQGTALSLVMLDVDHFKKFNDRYGHPAGDECLRRVGGCLRIVTRRAGELAARYGGEEFALLLPGSSSADAVDVAERLRAAIASMAMPHEAHPLGIVTASLGVATFDADRITDASALIAEADRALYRAKSSGRNCVVCS